MRLAALMELPVIYIFTHDSIGVGEDGPTHQPVEHLAALRAIPGLTSSARPTPTRWPRPTASCWPTGPARLPGPDPAEPAHARPHAVRRRGGPGQGGYVLADAPAARRR